VFTDTYVVTLQSDDETLTKRLGAYRVVEIRAAEGIGQLARYDVHLVHWAANPEEEIAITEDQVLGGEVSIRVAPAQGESPAFVRHGMVSEAKVARLTDPENPTIRVSLWLTIVPRFWRATLIATQEIHLDMALPAIIAAKLERIGLERAHEMRLLGHYAPAEIISQIAESDVAFVSRWLEREGIGYYFDHTSGKDVVVFADDIEAYGDGSHLAPDVELVEGDLRVTRHGKLVSRFFGVDDYNYRTPRVSLLHMQEVELGYAGGVLEYGSHHATPDEAARQARLRAEAHMLERRHIRCDGASPAICAGFRYTLTTADGRRQPILVVEASHHFTQSFGTTGRARESAMEYATSFVAVPADQPYRPPRSTPWPRMLGLQTGVIQPAPDGKTNGVAILDSEGRYTVQLHYDSLNGDRVKSSHPVRMAQPFAGPNQGMHFPLRPGTEVLLAYINGDPDRPVIVGAVPNAETRSPVRADSANRSRITTASGVKLEISEGR
jgi:type VI secretion system secreted protein VgrG